MSFLASIRSRLAAALAPAPGAGRSSAWLPIVNEPYTGAWQKNDPLYAGEGLHANPAIFACETRIARDIAKLPVKLAEETAPDVWELRTNPAYTPVLRKPNHYQTTPQFIEQWILAKLGYGNAYILKRRDARGVVDAFYCLQSQYVMPLVAADGSVYYELRRPDVDLTGLWAHDHEPKIVAASEIVHDRFNCFYHPLMGIPPLYAAALTATQGSIMQAKATEFFSNRSDPGGILLAPGEMPEDAADVQEKWRKRKTGDIAILAGGMKYEALAVSAVDAQFIEQLTFTIEQIAMIYGVPLVLLMAKGGQASGNEPVIQLYHDEGLQPLIGGVEYGYDQACEFQPSSKLGVMLDIDDLLWLDSGARTKAATDSVRGGVLSPNEARRKYYGLGSVEGGDTPYMQQQQFSLGALAERDANDPFLNPQPALPAAEPEPAP